MKNLFVKSLSFSVMALLAGLFVSCGPQVTPEPDDPDKPVVDPTDSTVVEKPYVGDFALEVKTVAADYVEFLVTAPSEVEIAYQVVAEEMVTSPASLIRSHTNVGTSHHSSTR